MTGLMAVYSVQKVFTSMTTMVHAHSAVKTHAVRETLTTIPVQRDAKDAQMIERVAIHAWRT